MTARGPCHLGIDPGLSGALALYNAGLGAVEVFDTPTLEINGKRIVDLATLALWFRENGPRIGQATIEQVGAMPGQGVSSMFKFGEVYGIAQAFVAAHFIPIQLVRPNVWKKALGLNGEKDASRRLASQHFPEYAYLWSRVKDDGRAESALIALYGSSVSR